MDLTRFSWGFSYIIFAGSMAETASISLGKGAWCCDTYKEIPPNKEVRPMFS